MSAVATTTARTAERRSWGPAWYGLLAGGMAVGVGCFVYQWVNGLAVTGLSNTISWGMYVITFMFLVGISAGGLLVARPFWNTALMAPMFVSSALVSGLGL